MKRGLVRSASGEGQFAAGGYELKFDGKWHAGVCITPQGEDDTDWREIGQFDDRMDAIAALWLARNEAFSH